MAPRARVFTVDNAKEKIADKLWKAAGKGAATFVPARATAEKRAIFDQALGEMVAAKLVVLLSSSTKPKYFLGEFAPSPARAAEKIEQYAALQHPALLAEAGFKKALATEEKTLLPQAIQLLKDATRLIALRSGKSEVFAHADSLRALLGIPFGNGAGAARAIEAETVREAYRSLVRRTGFPDVEIAALQRESGAELSALKEWLLIEHGSGRANFYLGDWSLADDRKRTGVIELRGERYLLVRLED